MQRQLGAGAAGNHSIKPAKAGVASHGSQGRGASGVRGSGDGYHRGIDDQLINVGPKSRDRHLDLCHPTAVDGAWRTLSVHQGNKLRCIHIIGVLNVAIRPQNGA